MWALVQDGVVIETTNVDPDGRYHPHLAWLPCGVDVKPNWSHSDEGFLEPVGELQTTETLERLWRDAELTTTEWLVSRHRDEQDMQLATTLTADQFADLLVYRQALRDWPQTEAFPDSAQRPVAPAWIAEQVL